MSEASEIVARREAAERRRREEEKAERFSELIAEIGPLAVEAVDNMRRLDFPCAPSSYSGIRTVDGSNCLVWTLVSDGRYNVILLDDGTLRGMEPGVPNEAILNRLREIARYGLPPEEEPKPRTTLRSWLHMHLQAQGIIR